MSSEKYCPFCRGLNVLTPFSPGQEGGDIISDKFKIFFNEPYFQWGNPQKHYLVIGVQCVNISRYRQNNRHFADAILKCIFLKEKNVTWVVCSWWYSW